MDAGHREHQADFAASTTSDASRTARPLHAQRYGKAAGRGLSSREFIPGRYCRDCGWPFPASHNRAHCRVPQACMRRQELPLSLRGPGCPRNNRVHPRMA